MPSETKPVEDSVPKVNNEVAVGSDLNFQRRWWRFERGAWVVLTLIVLLDIAGAFGRGPLANARVKSQDGSMDVKYERIERFSTPSILTIQFGANAIRDGKVRLWVSEDLVKSLGNQRVVPEPLESVIGQGGIFYTFAATVQPASVEFALQPATPGIFHLTLRLPGQAELKPTVYVVP